MISTRQLGKLPRPGVLKRLSQSLALLDAILCQEAWLRTYSFVNSFGQCDAMASMNNGSGDEYFILFTPVGAVIKGFAHESPMSPYRLDPPQPWPGVLDSVPSQFLPYITDPALSLADSTFCVWQDRSDRQWERGDIQFPLGPDPDGSEYLLSILDGNPVSYWVWAKDYYDRDVDLSAVESIYAHEEISGQLIGRLNKSAAVEGIRQDLEQIGYPGARPS
jgi:hypothetical protein